MVDDVSPDSIPPLAVAHVANAMIYGLQGLAFAYLYHRRRDTSLGLWLCASILMLGFSIAGAISAFTMEVTVEVPCLLFLLAAYACLTDGALRFAGRRLSPLLWTITALIGLWAGIAVAAGLPFRTAALPAGVWLPFVLISGGVRLLRAPPGATLGGRCAALGLIGSGVHFADYPLLRQVEWFAPFGFSIASLLELVVVVGLLALHFEAAQRRAQFLAADLAQARKLEALGRVAGGIAHDFNNLLTVILAGAQTLGRVPGLTAREKSLAGAVAEAADRAAELTGQLLAFSRRHKASPRITDVVACTRKMTSTVRSIAGEGAQLELQIASSPLAARIDPSQLSQLILNLVVNARDAMPDGGTLSLGVSKLAAGSPELDDVPNVAPVDHVLLEVRDTGTGMPDEVLERAFEPFYTTKEGHAGTGLGLAIVHGIVNQAAGHIHIASQVGEGTTVRVFLPAEAAEKLAQEEQAAALPGSGTALLVDDEPLLRAAARQILEGGGYQVIEAVDGAAAMQLFREHVDQIAVVVSDIVMPRMTGIELARQLLAHTPRLPILLVSGYPDRIAASEQPLDPETAFLAKPYTPDGLLAAITRIRGRASATMPNQTG